MGAVYFPHPQKTSRTGRLPSDPEDLSPSSAWSCPGAAEQFVTWHGKPPLGEEAGRPLCCCPHCLPAKKKKNYMPARRMESLLYSGALNEEGGRHVRFPLLRLPDRPEHLILSQAVTVVWQSQSLSPLSHARHLRSSWTKLQNRHQALSVSSPLGSAAKLYEDNACAQC
jgi:hypothetical protein